MTAMSESSPEQKQRAGREQFGTMSVADIKKMVPTLIQYGIPVMGVLTALALGAKLF